MGASLSTYNVLNSLLLASKAPLCQNLNLYSLNLHHIALLFPTPHQLVQLEDKYGDQKSAKAQEARR